MATTYPSPVTREPVDVLRYESNPISKPSQTERLQSLDAYRGLIMLTLLSGGALSSLKGHPWLDWLGRQNDHVRWEGCVYWDLIQPSFMFMVGVAMPFAFAKRAARGATWGHQFIHVLIRALNLMLIGILLDHFGQNKIEIGFIRVLQQIAIGYVLAFFVVGKSFWVQGGTAAIILVGYSLLWMFNPYNGRAGPWAMGNKNIGSVVDFWMLGRYYSGFYVGMNAIPSTATIIFGVMAGKLIMEDRPKIQIAFTLLVAGLIGIMLGVAASKWNLPLIKRIWTPSFAVYAAGWTSLMLLFFYFIIEVVGYKRWAFPLVVVGMNSIAAYVISGAFGGWFRSFSGAWIARLEPRFGIGYPIFQRFLFMCFAWGVLYWLYRRKIFFKA